MNFSEYEKIYQEAIQKFHSREFYSYYPEAPSKTIYGEQANEEGLKAFTAQLRHPFQRLLQDADEKRESSEVSPYTQEKLSMTYPVFKDKEKYLSKSKEAFKKWKKVSLEERSTILMNSLEKMKKHFFEIAYATMHTTGQGFMMSFQASGPHAADRALEALSLGYHELSRFSSSTKWVKPMGKFQVVLEKQFTPAPKGCSLAIGCSTFPIWNTLPGVFASLITGNTVLVKPHPRAVYPLALGLSFLQEALKEAGQDPHTAQLVVDTVENPLTQFFAENEEIKIVDYTGCSSFGSYIESLKKTTFTEKAGVNSVIIDSCDSLEKMVQNLAFSVALYSGQMCTAPQNFFIPKSGIVVGNTTVSFEDFAKAFTTALSAICRDEKMGPSTLGAIQNEQTLQRIKKVQGLGKKLWLESYALTNPEFPKAQTATPVVVEVTAQDKALFSQEMFGPIVFLIATNSTEEGLQLAKELAQTQGAISCAAYTTRVDMKARIAEEMQEAFTSVSFNLTGMIWVNQNAAFSDFHVSGGNPAGNASITDPQFIQKRFHWVSTREVSA